MATLQPGEKARMYALGNIARGGATRGGYVGGLAFITIDGIHVGVGGTPGAAHVGVLLESLTITDALNEAANTCTFRLNGQIPTAGAEVRITIGSKNRIAALFAGFALRVDQRYAADRSTNIQADVSCVDYTWLFGFVKVTAVYRAKSASAIAADLVARFAGANGFTSRGVAPYLPNLDEITFTNEELDQAMTRLAQRIGAYWYVDYQKDVHLFVDEAGNGNPESLVVGHRSLSDLHKTADRTQALTRVYVEGRGTSILGAVAPGDTLIPVEAIDMFEVAPDVFAKVSPHGSEGAAEWISYTGVIAGGAGSLVGPGGGPPGAPSVALSATVGSLAPGTYQYGYTDVTPTGETTPSPIATITIGPVVIPNPPATAAALVAQVAASGGVTSGTHKYCYTYVSAAGAETLAGPESANVQTKGPMYRPGGGGGLVRTNVIAGGTLPYGDSNPYTYDCTYVGNAGGETAGQGGAYAYVQQNYPTLRTVTLDFYPPTDGTVAVKVYRRNPGQQGFYFIGNATINNGVPMFTDNGSATQGSSIPLTDTAQVNLQQIRVTTGASADPTVVAMKLYRKRTDISGSYKLVAQVDGSLGGVTYYDLKTDGSLGAAPPTTTPTAPSAVVVSNLAAGPSPTSSRRLYRTAKNTAQLKLLTTLADNTSTSFVDTIADASLGATPPASDTSGLQNQTAGQVGAGATTLPVGTAVPFEPGGGWAVVGNGEQVIRYTGKTAKALTGIPPTGIGAIIAGIAYNSTITAAPMVTGIPTSGPYAIVEAMNAGDELNVVVRREDGARALTLATMIKIGPGWREEWVQDRRLSIDEARARGDATLARRPLEELTIHYRCRDLRTASGKAIAVSLPAPTNIAGTFKIQSVTISNFRPFKNQYPTFTVTASSALFSFEDWLRRFDTKV